MDYNENLTPQYRIEEYLEAIVEGWVDATVVAYPDYPSWRLEEFLDAFITYIWEDGDHPRRPCPDPVWRLEGCLRAIYDVMTGAATPWAFPLPPTNRIEEYLAAIHAYLADNTELPVPEPAWRIEQWLAYVLDAVKQGGGGTETTVTGNLPLTLANALSQAIVSLKRYGLCTQATTPTPGAPVDIMCNNGALKWDSVNQRVYADGTPEVLTVSGPNLLNTATNITGKYITASGGISNGDDAQYTDLIPVKAGETYACSFVSGRNSGNIRWHAYDANGTWVKQLESVSATGQQGAKLVMVATIDSGISYVRLSYGITDTEAMVFAFGSQEISWEGYYPVTNYASNNAAIDTSTVIQSPYTAPAGNRGPAVLCEVEQGKVYTVKSTVGADSFGMKATFYSSKDDVTNAGNGIGHTPLNKQGGSFAPVSGAAYAVISCIGAQGKTFTFDANSIKVYCGEADYQPYVPPQTASAPMLLSVGDVKDEVELIHGTLTRRVTSCLYDGTQPVGDVYMSTTGGKDNGAIIVYPLATPATEHITAQPLNTNEGTNIVDSVANISPLEAEVKYIVASAQDVLSKLLGMKVTKNDISTQDAEEMIDIITGEENK